MLKRKLLSDLSKPQRQNIVQVNLSMEGIFDILRILGIKKDKPYVNPSSSNSALDGLTTEVMKIIKEHHGNLKWV